MLLVNLFAPRSSIVSPYSPQTSTPSHSVLLSSITHRISLACVVSVGSLFQSAVATPLPDAREWAWWMMSRAIALGSVQVKELALPNEDNVELPRVRCPISMTSNIVFTSMPLVALRSHGLGPRIS